MFFIIIYISIFKSNLDHFKNYYVLIIQKIEIYEIWMIWISRNSVLHFSPITFIAFEQTFSCILPFFSLQIQKYIFQLLILTKPILSWRTFLMTSFKNLKSSQKSEVKLFRYIFPLLKHKQIILKCSKTSCNFFGYSFPFLNDVI